MNLSSGKTIQPRLLTYAAACCVLLAALLCGGCSKTNPPNWKDVLGRSPKNGQNGQGGDATRPAADRIVVYLDTSASMAGYISRDRRGQTVFSRTLQELRNLTTIHNPPMDVVVRHVDTAVGAPLGDSDLSVASVDPSVYGGRETDLAGAIGAFSRPVEPPRKPDPAAGQPADEPPPARYHILVTDGVQSTSQQRPNLGCTAGSDQVCVRKKILELLNKGWGAAVIGLRSEFDGKVFSEIAGTVINYQSRGGDQQTYRPFYIYLFSPDRAELDKLAAVLTERLSTVVGGGAIRELALTSAYADGFARSSVAITKGKESALELSRAREEEPSRHTLRVDVDTEASGPESFALTVEVPWSGRAQYAGTPRERAELVSWSLQPVYHTHDAEGKPEGWRYPELKIVEQSVDDEGRAQLRLAAQWPRATGEPGWRVYRLEGRLNLESQTPAWVREWSTNLDTTPEAANKTLNLESALLGLWRNDVLRDQCVAETYIRVGPR